MSVWNRHTVLNNKYIIRYYDCILLFQQTLRRMCYLTIKEMANISEDVIIVTSRFVSRCFFLGWWEGYLKLTARCKCYHTVTPQYMKHCVHLSLEVTAFYLVISSYDVLQPDQRHDRKGRCLPWTCNQSPLQDYRCEFCFCFDFPHALSPSLPHCHYIQKKAFLIMLTKLSIVLPQTTMLQAIERYMKQAIVDKVPSVSSSALVSSLVRSVTLSYFTF